jgi:hypothetical protein
MTHHSQSADASQVDLFGDPVDTPAVCTTAERTPSQAVNDMDLAQAVLADIAGEKTPPLHLDDDNQVRRCTQRGTEPVPDDVAVVVRQLLAARYLETRKRSCPGHGSLIATTRTGRGAVHRWAAYHRPPAWGPAPHHDTNRQES